MRYEAARAVYHAMACGDGGKTVFEDDKDRYGWVDLMERCCARFGWAVHAWVLMGNHFHVPLAKDAKQAVTDASLKELKAIQP